jgi:hypothetical protein
VIKEKTIEEEEEEKVFVTDDNKVKSQLAIPTNEQSWKSMAYMGVATAVGGALLLSLVYMRR